MKNISVSQHPCLVHERAASEGKPTPPCGPTWYQFTVGDHTLGGCSLFVNDEHGPRYVPFGGHYAGKVTTDRDTGQVTLELLDTDQDPPVAIAALAFTPKAVDADR